MHNKLLLLGVFAVTLVACKKQKTVWNTDWKAPLINDTLDLRNLVNDSTLTTQTGNYFVDLTRTVQSFNLLNEIEIPDTTISNQLTIIFQYLDVMPGSEFIADSEEQSLNLPNDIELHKVLMGNGFIDFTIKNPASTKAFFTVSLPGAFKDGQVLQRIFEVPAAQNGAKGVFEGSVDISGYMVDMTGLNGNERNKFLTQVNVQTDPDGPTVQVTNSDVIDVVATFRDVKLAYAKGHFGSISLKDTSEVNIGFFDKIQSGLVDFPQSEVSIEIENGIKAAARAKLNFISNENSSGSIVSLSHPQMGSNLLVNVAADSWANLQPSLTSITFNGANSNIEDFLENLGSMYKVGYDILLNPWGNISSGTEEIFPNSRLKLKLKAKMPLKLGLQDLIFQDTFDLNVNQNYESTHVTKGDLIFEFTNAFPVNAGLELKLLDANGAELMAINPTGIIESAVLGSVDSNSGLMTRDSKMVISLSEEQVKALNDAKFLMLRAFSNTNNVNGVSQQMDIPEGAFLKVLLKGNLQTENKF